MTEEELKNMALEIRDRRYFTSEMLAKYFRLETQTVGAWIREGRLNAAMIQHGSRRHYLIPVEEIFYQDGVQRFYPPMMLRMRAF